MLRLIFDSNSLITACKFHYQNLPVLNYFLKNCEITVPLAVKIEVVDPGSTYEDAIYARSLLETGQIKAAKLFLAPDDILMHYKIGTGEREAIMLYLQMKPEIDFLVTDDRLAYIVCDRLGIDKILFLDLIVQFVRMNFFTSHLAKEIVQVIKSRYPEGFIYHTIKLLEMEKQNAKSSL
jgi:predicted nucleic acid-binding protein